MLGVLDFTCVQEEMVFEIGNLAETSVTDWTSVGPGSVVDVHVRFEISRSWKRFLAQLALMGLLLEQNEAIEFHDPRSKLTIFI